MKALNFLICLVYGIAYANTEDISETPGPPRIANERKVQAAPNDYKIKIKVQQPYMYEASQYYQNGKKQLPFRSYGKDTQQILDILAKEYADYLWKFSKKYTKFYELESALTEDFDETEDDQESNDEFEETLQEYLLEEEMGQLELEGIAKLESEFENDEASGNEKSGLHIPLKSIKSIGKKIPSVMKKAPKAAKKVLPKLANLPKRIIKEEKDSSPKPNDFLVDTEDSKSDSEGIFSFGSIVEPLIFDTEIHLFGITVNDGIASVHEVTISKLKDDNFKIDTPNGSSITSPFALSLSDENSLLDSPGKKARLLYIHQNGLISNFINTDFGELGFLDFNPEKQKSILPDAKSKIQEKMEKTETAFIEQKKKTDEKKTETLKTEEKKIETINEKIDEKKLLSANLSEKSELKVESFLESVQNKVKNFFNRINTPNDEITTTIKPTSTFTEKPLDYSTKEKRFQFRRRPSV